MEIDKIKEEGETLKREIKKRTITYITAAFGLVAGLAWNEAIKALIEYFFPLDTGTLLAKFVYALVITFVLVLITVHLAKLLSGTDEKKS